MSRTILTAAIVAAHGLMVSTVAVASAAAAPASIAHPDLSGVWQIVGASKTLHTVDGRAPPLLPQAQAIYQQHIKARTAGDTSDDPIAKCLPPGIPRLLLQSMPFRIVQQPNLIAMVFQWNHLDRLIYFDIGHFEAVAPAYLGQSVGQWQGNTLVVDTNGFNAESLLDDSGLPHSDALHLIEHYSLRDGGRALDDRITIDDPQTFAGSWETILHFARKSVRVRDDDYCLGRIGAEPMNLK